MTAEAQVLSSEYWARVYQGILVLEDTVRTLPTSRTRQTLLSDIKILRQSLELRTGDWQKV